MHEVFGGDEVADGVATEVAGAVTVLKVHREVPLCLLSVVEGVIELYFVEVELVFCAGGSGTILKYCGERDVVRPGTIFCEEALCCFGANELAQGRAGYMGDVAQW